jgi:hypothetical protein
MYMKKQAPMKAKDPVTGKYVKADNCFVAFAKLSLVGVVLIVGIGLLNRGPTPVIATPEVENTQPEVDPITERQAALEREASDALDRVQSGRIEDNYSNFLDRQQQHKANLEYCAKNRTDWSCTDGQYAGQY